MNDILKLKKTLGTIVPAVESKPSEGYWCSNDARQVILTTEKYLIRNGAAVWIGWYRPVSLDGSTPDYTTKEAYAYACLLLFVLWRLAVESDLDLHITEYTVSLRKLQPKRPPALPFVPEEAIYALG